MINEKENPIIIEIKAEIRKFLPLYLRSSGELSSDKERKIKEFIGDFDNLFKVTDHNFDTIRTAHYFIYIQERLPNFNKSLKNYLLHINHSTHITSSVERGIVKGKIDWKLTNESRMRCGNDRSLFNCREICKSYDQPENILLKYLILNIDKQLKFLEKQLNPSDNSVDKSWMRAIANTREIINFAERNVYFQKIRTENITIDSRLIYQIRHSRDRFCKELLLEAYELYKDILLPSLLMLSKNSEKLLQIIEETEINPRDDDELFELYASLEDHR